MTTRFFRRGLTAVVLAVFAAGGCTSSSSPGDKMKDDKMKADEKMKMDDKMKADEKMKMDGKMKDDKMMMDDKMKSSGR